jgi:hypothetical protein
MTSVIPWVGAADEDPEEPSRLPGAARNWLVAKGSLPSPVHLKHSVKWWLTYGLKHLVALGLKTPYLLLLELLPIFRGVGRVVSGWVRWCAASHYTDAIAVAEGSDRAKHAERLEKTRSGRRKLTLAAVLALGGTVWWAAVAQPLWLILAGFALVVVFDFVGRAGREKSEAPIIFPRSHLAEGMPLSSLRAELQRILEFEGFDPDSTVVDLPMPVRNGWRVPYHSRAAVDDAHLRLIEPALQIRRNGITQVKDPGNSALGELWITLADPLADVIPSPELSPLSVYGLLPLGVNANGGEWVEAFLRAHFLVVGASRSGKSSLFWQIIYVLRKCAEVELDAIDLTDGPCFSACRRAFRRRATDEDGAKRILTEAVALIKQRVGELSRLAEDDDTPDEFDENHQPSREHPQRVVLIDEGARVTENKELLPLVEYILRYGAKAAVVLGIAGQGGGLDDFGSSIVRGQIMLKIMMACSRGDVLSIFGKDARDSGYRPDLLEPAQGDEIRDAGKAFVQSATSSSPEMRRAYRLEQADVRRRDRQLGARAETYVDAIEAAEVPAALTLLETVFAEHSADRIPSAMVLKFAMDHGDQWTDMALADALRPHGVETHKARTELAEGRSVMCYYRTELQAALGAL